jgi:hypothetical protein
MLLNINNQIVSAENSIGESTKIITPSVWNQTKAHPARSSRYSVVKTPDVVEAFVKAGFSFQEISKKNASKPENRGYETHLGCFEHPSFSLAGKLGSELTPRLYFRNSYNGETKMSFSLGLYRLYCKNGLMLGSNFKTITHKHIGITQTDIENIRREMEYEFAHNVVPTIISLKNTQMSEEQQSAFARTVLMERVKSNEKFIKGEHVKLLTVKREEDRDDSMWNVMNRVQENLGLNFGAEPIELSYTYEAVDKDNVISHKERNLRKLTGLNAVSHMNRFLFDEAVNLLTTQDESIEMIAA